MKPSIYTLSLSVLLLSLTACHNRDISEGEQFKPREIHDDIPDSFDKIIVDGIEYLILERDNNNPHEGFGFMAFRANRLMEKQDSLIAHVRTLTDLQAKTYAAVTKKPLDEIQQEIKAQFDYYLQSEAKELESLEKSTLKSDKKLRSESKKD